MTEFFFLCCNLIVSFNQRKKTIKKNPSSSFIIFFFFLRLSVLFVSCHGNPPPKKKPTPATEKDIFFYANTLSGSHKSVRVKHLKETKWRFQGPPRPPNTSLRITKHCIPKTVQS